MLRVRDLSARARVGVIGLTVAVSAVLAIASNALTPPGSVVAVWWPAAGVGVAAVLFAHRRPLVVAAVIGVVTMLTVALVSHRPLALAVIGGVVNGAETYLFARVLLWRGHRAILTHFADVRRVFIAGGLSASMAGILGGIGIWLVTHADPVSALSRIVPSHFSATVLIVPLVLVRFRRTTLPKSEFLVQSLVVTAVFVGVFWPGQSLPLAFLPLPFLLWAAFRFPLAVVVIQLVTAASVTLILTLSGGGPFHRTELGNPASMTTLVQVYFLTMCASVLVLGALRNEREVLLRRVAAAERSLRAGLGQAQVGFVVLSPSAGELQVLDINPAALEMLSLGASPTTAEVDAATHGRILAHIQQMTHGRAGQASEEWDDASGRHLQLLIASIPSVGGPNAYTIQLVDTTIRHQTERALAAALQNETQTAATLREASRRQDEFVSAVTHDLRTPIASIMGFAEELQETPLTEEQNSYLRVVTRNATRLLALVNNLLKLAELQHGSVAVASAPVAVSSLVAECVEDLSAMATAKGVRLVDLSARDSTRMTGYALEVTQILANLTSNAIKFTPAGGTVTITTREDGDSVILSVADDGIGIPPEELPHVMERFGRSTLSSSIQGTGLGLAVVAGLAATLHGTFTLESDGVTGTTAVVRLPAAGSDAVAVDLAAPARV